MDLLCRRNDVNSDLIRSFVKAIGDVRRFLSLRKTKTSPRKKKIKIDIEIVSHKLKNFIYRSLNLLHR